MEVQEGDLGKILHWWMMSLRVSPETNHLSFHCLIVAQQWVLCPYYTTTASDVAAPKSADRFS
jgi:hypothetical protein